MKFESETPDEVYPNLLVSGISSARQYAARNHDDPQLDRVVTVAQDSIADDVSDGVVYSQYNMADGPADYLDGESSFELFEQAAIEVQTALVEGERVLLHCHAGVSRSPAVAAAVVGVQERLPYLEVIDRLRDVRPRIGPNPILAGYARHYLLLYGIEPIAVNEELMREVVAAYREKHDIRWDGWL